MRKHNLVLGTLSLLVLLTIWTISVWKGIYERNTTDLLNPYLSSHSGILATARAEDSRLVARPTPTPTPAPGTPSRDQIEREIDAVWSPSGQAVIKQAKKVAQCESSFIANNSNGKDHGLFQIRYVHGYSRQTLFNYQKNIRIAYAMYLKSGWLPWKSSLNCHGAR